MLRLNKYFKSAVLMMLLIGSSIAISSGVNISEEDDCKRNDLVTITNPQTNEKLKMKRLELVLSYAKQFVDYNHFTFSKAQEDILIKKWCDYSNKMDKSANQTETLDILKDMNKDFETTVDQFIKELGKSHMGFNVSKFNI